MKKLKNGFTLVELLMAMLVGMTILLAMSSMMDISLKSSSGVGRRVLTQQDARAVMDLMAMEIGMASFMKTPTWTGNMLNSCNAVAISNIRKGIQVATPNQIGVAMDLDDSNTICNVANEYIVYTYNSGNGTITRSVSCGNHEAILGGTGSFTMVRNNLTSPVTPLFQYFNVAGTELTTFPLTDANIGLIRRIRINFIADVETGKVGSFKTSTRTYSTDVLVRNHAMQP